MAGPLWSLTARRDLRAIRDYISFDSPNAARALIARIRAAARRAHAFPRIGRVVPEFGDEDIRELILENYRVVYVLKEGRVHIARVIHSAMDMRRISIEGP